MEENEEEDIDIKNLATGLDVSPTMKFSDLLNDRQNVIPDFSSLSNEAIAEMEQFSDFQPSKAVDKAVISTNQASQDIKISMMSSEGQPVSERGNDAPNRYAGLDNTLMGTPAEMDTEELPADMGGATPRASKGISNLRGNVDIRTKGNPYGYA